MLHTVLTLFVTIIYKCKILYICFVMIVHIYFLRKVFVCETFCKIVVLLHSNIALFCRTFDNMPSKDVCLLVTLISVKESK